MPPKGPWLPKPAPPNPSGLCMCGCGQTTPVARCTCRRDGMVHGEHLRFVRGHNSFAKRGFPWFNATRGRWYVNGRDGHRIPWARVVLERELGRPLRDDEHAHHVNGDKADDRPENLQALTVSEYTRLHLEEAGAVTNQSGVWPLKH